MFTDSYSNMPLKPTKNRKPLSDAQIEQRRNAAKQKRTMTPAAIEQRQNAAQLSTGPKTEDGKAASSRNNWKHGAHSMVAKSQLWKTHGLNLLAKPCKSTCDKFPCSLVEDGATEPGQDCLDKQVFVQAFDALLGTLQTGDTEYVHGMMASEIANTIELLATMRKSISDNGVVVIKPYITKDGTPIRDPSDANKLLGDLIPNPLLTHVQKYMDTLGINLPELMATPRAVSNLKKDDDDKNEIKDLFTSIGGALKSGLENKTSKTFEHEATN